MTPEIVLEKYWGYSAFRPQQKEIIDSVLNGEHTFVILPTGGGKSLCYQIPGLLLEGSCLVISPLIALMNDQVTNLKKRGIKAIALNSTLHPQDFLRELDNCQYGQYQFIYISPERLQSEIILERLSRMNINLIAVDEAHCISQWGHDFRPAYRNIVEVMKRVPKVPVIALTGSAKPEVADDIKANLNLENPNSFSSSFRRPNLAYMIFETENKLERLQLILKKNVQSSIIYVRNRRQTQELSTTLKECGFSATYYHGGMSNTEKKDHYEQWLNNRTQVMVATNAFGMGIDKPDVKTVIHLDLPENLENYYQEAGRAGRNGQKAFAITLKNEHDEKRLVNQHIAAQVTVKDLKYIYRKLCSYLAIAFMEGEDTTHDFNIFEFSKTYELNVTKVLNALTFLDRQGILKLTKEFHHKSKIHFLVDNYTIINFISQHKEINTFIQFILRNYGGAFENVIEVNINHIASGLQISKEQVKQNLQFLEHHHLIDLTLFESDMRIIFLEPREDDRTINRIAKYLTQQNSIKKKNVDAVLALMQTHDSCVEQRLLSYFGEIQDTPCGVCHYCIDKKRLKVTNKDLIFEAILGAVKPKALTAFEIISVIEYQQTEVLEAIRLLLDASKIEMINNKYQLKTT